MSNQYKSHESWSTFTLVRLMIPFQVSVISIFNHFGIFVKFGRAAYWPTFENSNFSSLSWTRKYWKVHPRGTVKYPSFQSLCKLGKKCKYIDSVKSVQIWSYFWTVFSCISTEYRNLRTRNNSVFGQFIWSEPNTDIEKS